MTVFHNGAPRPFVDGAGLCSPSRWEPEDRAVDMIAQQIHEALVSLLREHFGDLSLLAFRLACGRFPECPFPEQLLQEGRRRVIAIIGHGGSGKAQHLEEVPEDQPFFLFLLAEVARILGDPDWRVLAHRTRSYASGVPVGVHVQTAPYAGSL